MKLLSVVSIQFHPRDIGTLLIGYSEGAALSSFKKNKPTRFFQYEVPRGASGGNPDLAGPHEVRRPRLSHAVWHLNGTCILTAHEDSSLVLWDARDGRIVEARTIQTTAVHLPGGGASRDSANHVKSVKQHTLILPGAARRTQMIPACSLREAPQCQIRLQD
jgi:syntaxin-binding protein 5